MEAPDPVGRGVHAFQLDPPFTNMHRVSNVLDDQPRFASALLSVRAITSRRGQRQRLQHFSVHKCFLVWSETLAVITASALPVLHEHANGRTVRMHAFHDLAGIVAGRIVGLPLCNADRALRCPVAQHCTKPSLEGFLRWNWHATTSHDELYFQMMLTVQCQLR